MKRGVGDGGHAAWCPSSPPVRSVTMSEKDTSADSTLEFVVTPRAHVWALDVQDDGGCKRVLLSAETLVLGSSARSDVVIHDKAVSARHCAVNVQGGGVAVTDLGSRNGTFVGGARVKEACAGPGTAITIGQTTLVCSSLGDEIVHGDIEPLPQLAGASLAMRQVAAQVRRLAQHNAPVLIAGESGTGKELIARSLHREGPRTGQPFVAVNVAALPRELVETEMFGHERGAFTGAVAKRAGAFAEAEGGTLFLDEIGELPIDAQPKLLRALDGYEVRKVGGSAGRLSNVRVVAATHVPLEAKVLAGGFRRDLFHRLEVFVIEVPPLRARREDIAPIARTLMDRMASEVGGRTLTSSAVALLSAYEWPGNVRELRNVLYRACDAASTSALVDARHIERGMGGREEPEKRVVTPSLARALLRTHENNLSAAARAIGCPRTTFRKVLKGA
jgi:transcriptional regulator of acetoin/glycerol metabolism